MPIPGVPSIFGSGGSYDDLGNLQVASSQPFQNAKLSVTVLGAAGRILMNMYDGNTTTVCQLGVSTAGTCLVKWEFDGKPKFKQLNATVTLTTGTSVTWTLEGSQNNSDWTVLDTKTTGTNGTYGLLATDAQYKYIRLKNVAGSANQNVGIAGITGSTT
jgi:hypothetical protein